MGFRPAIELGNRRGRPRPGGEGGHRPHLQEAAAHAGDGGQADVEGLGDALIRPAGTARRFVRLEQNPGVGLRPGGRFADANHLLQGGTLLVREGDAILDARGVQRGVGWDDSGQFHPATLQKTCLPVTSPVTEH